MRIIAGSLGGRVFKAPSGHRTHPMSEKIRGAIFNALGDISDLTVLDAFTGSGALCFEAVSRGVANATGSVRRQEWNQKRADSHLDSRDTRIHDIQRRLSKTQTIQERNMGDFGVATKSARRVYEGNDGGNDEGNRRDAYNHK